MLHSSYSNIRLESYLFTTQAFADIKKRLKPGGLFVMYNYFRQGWIVSRLQGMLEQTFGAGNPIVFNLPTKETVRPDDVLFGEFTVFCAGATSPIKEAFARHPEYWLANGRVTDPSTPNGFEVPNAAARNALIAGPPEARAAWLQFRRTKVVLPETAQQLATDSWPFLYLQRPMIPSLSLRGMAIMGTVGLLFVLPFVRRPASAQTGGRWPRPPSVGFLAQMFFLGAGFMLIETKAVVHMALLFGGTWLVNSIVFCAVLVMILVANLFVLAVRPRSLVPFLCGTGRFPRRQRARAARCLPRSLSHAAGDRILCARVHADCLCWCRLRGVVQPRRRRGPRIWRQHRRRDVRRAVRIQLDAARLPVRGARGGRLLSAFSRGGTLDVPAKGNRETGSDLLES